MASNTNTADGRPKKDWRVAGICLALATLAFAVFGQTLGHDFVNYDDNVYVYDNPMVAPGLTPAGIRWAFTCFQSANWHPLTWISHMLDCQLYAMNPAGHHLTSVLLHTTTAILLFLVLREMTGALWRSAFVAAVFALHPLRVESVAWVAERKDVLSGLFFVLTVGAYVLWTRRGRSLLLYGVVLLLFALGLMSKPMLVTLPVVLLLLDFWPLRRAESFGKLILEKLPLLALSAASCMVTVFAQRHEIQGAASFSFSARLANALASCTVYLGQMIWPAKLAVFYPFRQGGPPMTGVILAGLLVAAISAAAFSLRRQQPWLLTGWAWYLIMLLPVIGIVQVGAQAHADRYTYLPEIGIAIAVTWAVAELFDNRLILGVLMAAVLMTLVACAWRQTTYWQNSETLWRHTLDCTTDNATAHYDLGVALDARGRLDEAVSEYRAALQIDPNDASSHVNLGVALLKRGRTDEAMVEYNKALQIDPRDAATRLKLAGALRKEGKNPEAIAQFREALRLNPGDLETEVGLGITLLQTGQADEAITCLQSALKTDPSSGPAHNDLGNAYLQTGNLPEAIAQFQQAVELEPDDAWVKNNLAWLLATCPRASVRDGNKAVDLAAQANDLTGGQNPFILHTLAAAQAEAGRCSDALTTARQALQLAQAQTNRELAGKLQAEIKLYQTGHPVRVSPSAP